MQNGKKVYLISNGDYRDSAGVVCWEKQASTLVAVSAAVNKLGRETEVLPAYMSDRRHGFITRQCEGAKVFANIPDKEPVIVVLSCWAYANNVCSLLPAHSGPVLLVANFDGTWPGLVALLNHSATLNRMSAPHSKLWSETFADDAAFMKGLEAWLREPFLVKHDASHFTDGAKMVIDPSADQLGEKLAHDILRKKRIMGQFDPGCMGMYNAVMNPAKLAAIGMPVEYLSQSDLVAKMARVSDAEAQSYLDWLVAKGTWFDWGPNPDEKLTHAQVMGQMKMYATAARLSQHWGLAAIGIPYQIGLVDCCPASDLPEGMLNNSDRPDVPGEDGKPILPGKPIIHFNEGDIGSGVPQVVMCDIYQRKGMPPETTLHDVRWGKMVGDKWVWVFEISGAAPPAHFGGWNKTKVFRQPKMYFDKGGGTCSGVSKPGVITWARFYESFGNIGLDCGLGEVLDLPAEEVELMLAKTTKVWPIATVNIPGYGRDQLMATHMSNHITIGYGDILDELVATFKHLAVPVRVVEKSLSLKKA